MEANDRVVRPLVGVTTGSVEGATEFESCRSERTRQLISSRPDLDQDLGDGDLGTLRTRLLQDVLDGSPVSDDPRSFNPEAAESSIPFRSPADEPLDVRSESVCWKRTRSAHTQEASKEE